jgi:hypothetical protein
VDIAASIYSSIPGPGPPCLPICLAFNISSQSKRLDAMPELEAIAALITRKESYTPSSTGSIVLPVVRSRPTMLPSACSSWRSATIFRLISGNPLKKKKNYLRASWISCPEFAARVFGMIRRASANA